MIESLTGTFDGQSLLPDRQLPLVPGTRVKITVEAIGEERDFSTASRLAALDELDAMLEANPIYSSRHLTRDELHDRD